ncbi:MAG: glycerol kinase GlpK, partial [Chloroflexi bacterium]|nr:glycerol kinase GlpK [Chloroflexota bacterium]
AKTGLPIDAYFSGTKLRWILDNITDGQRRAEAGELAFGTVDTWLLWNLTNGTVHATDVTNASRTMLYNINTLQWDEDLLSELDIPKAILPDVRPSSHVFGYVGGNFFGGQSIPIAGMAGDQHAALFGQACFRPGMTKNTYGTGSFVLMNTGDRRTTSEHGLISTPAWSIGGRVTYALEGSIFSTGSTVQWLRDELCMIHSAAEVEALARSVEDNGGVYIVPAFTGLGAPHWDMYARGAVLGITRGTNRGHFARAALESTAYQTRDVIEAMKIDAGLDIALLRVDGGGSSNDLMMQFQADILDMPLERSQVVETTALGAAYLAGLAVGFWKDQEEIEGLWSASRRYDPDMTDDLRQRLCGRWSRAVDRALRWAEE